MMRLTVESPRTDHQVAMPWGGGNQRLKFQAHPIMMFFLV